MSALGVPVLPGPDALFERAGQPVAKLDPFQRTTELRRPGSLRGRVRMAQGFDALSDDTVKVRRIEDRSARWRSTPQPRERS
jgi:antitoxin (DNA-binding transcriptional repressor) of toxin-antitoxin stability system